MSFNLPELPFARDALVPYISEETINFHYGCHHKAYVDNLNKLIIGTEFEHRTLPDIITTSSGMIFNNAAQVWNHTFYWNCLQRAGNKQLPQELVTALNDSFGSVDNFKEAFTKVVQSFFGSGWVWLVQDVAGLLSIISTNNANNPLLAVGQIPLLTCDVWEHAYYIDYRNVRSKYLDAFWNVVNWGFVGRKID